MSMGDTHTPNSITRDIARLCREASRSESPVYVPLVPDDNAIPNMCFPNVSRVVAEMGGSVLHGWRIWEWTSVLVEAEFHAVWRRPDESLVDITPEENGERRILFLPDASKRFEGVQVDSIRMPLSNDPNVLELIRVSEQIYRVLNTGDRAGKIGLVSVPAREIESLLRRKTELVSLVRHPSPKRDGPCYCGSGRKYRKCCGNQRSR